MTADTETPSPAPRAARLHPRHRRRRPRVGPRQRRSSPGSRPSPTATSTSATPRPSASTSASRPSSAARCNLRFDDTNPLKEEQEYIDGIQADIRWLGFDWGENLFYASDYFEQLYAWAVHLIEHGKAFVDDLTADEIRETRGTLTEPGTNSPVPGPLRRGEPRPVRAHARRRVPERRPGAAGQDRHGRAQHQPARPRPLPDRAREPPADRRRLVHLPHLRLRARPVRCHRGRDPLAVHPRVRRPPGPLRLAHREPAGAVGPPPVRVRAPQPHLRRAVQAVPAQARQRRARPRLGRSPHAHDRGPAPARLSRPRASATSPPRSASPRPTASTSSRCSSTRSATS